MLQIELKRGLRRKTFVAALVICILFCVFEYLIYNYPYYSVSLKYTATLSDYLGVYLKGSAINSYDFFIFFSLTPLANILFILMPVLVAISYSDSYLEDLNSGFLKNILTRCSKKKYYVSKFLANFIISGITISIPLLINFLLTITTQVSGPPYKLITATALNGNLNMDMYLNHPFLYVLMWIGIYFLFAGAISSIALAFSIVTRNKFIVLITPFIVVQVIDILFKVMNLMDFSVSKFLYLYFNINPWAMAVTFLVMISATFIAFYFGGKKNEAF